MLHILKSLSCSNDFCFIVIDFLLSRHFAKPFQFEVAKIVSALYSFETGWTQIHMLCLMTYRCYHYCLITNISVKYTLPATGQIEIKV